MSNFEAIIPARATITNPETGYTIYIVTEATKSTVDAVFFVQKITGEDNNKESREFWIPKSQLDGFNVPY